MNPPDRPELAHRAFDLTPVMICDLAGRISFWGQGLEPLYGYTAHEVLGEVAQEVLQTRYPAAVSEIEQALEQAGRWSGELVERRRDGESIVVASRRALIRDEGGQAAGVVACNSDITRDKQALAERELLARIVEDSHEAVIGKTLDSRITTWNRGAEEIFGYSATEMVGHSILDLFPPDRRSEEAIILERLRRGERIEPYETERVTKDGRLISVSLTVSPVRNPSGEIVGASKFVRDITEQKALRDRIAELQAELLHISRLNDMGQMASAFAHELTQPLTAMSAYLIAARRLSAKGADEKTAEAFDRATGQLVRVGEVIERLRNFIRKSDAPRAPEDLKLLVDAAVSLVFIAARFPDTALRIDLAEDARHAVIDRVQIQQVLVNLLRNAAEAMQQAPFKEIMVTSRKIDEGRIEVAVADTGPGLPPEVQLSLFKPFTTTKENGMGVGLSLCRTIIEGHGGEIQADNQPSGGAVFRFSLPAAS